VPRAVIVGHFTLALIGLGLWIVFMVTGLPALAWAAVAVVVSVAGLGMATLAGGLPEQRQPSEGAPEPQPATTGRPGLRPAGTRPASAGLQPARMSAIGVPPGKPVTAIALHGTLAFATLMIVVLAAIGAS
jgi:manganese efflux pump family protein